MVNTRTIQGTILNIKTKWDKNNQQYLILKLDNNETIFVFANQANPTNQWNDLQVNQIYQFTVKVGKNNSNILTAYQTIINAQAWLDRNYPPEKRSEVEEICLTEPSLEGELDLGDFTYEYGVRVYISPQVDKTKLTFTNLPEYAKIIPKGVHGYANLNSLTNEGKTKLEILNISDENLEGELDLSDFINLKELNCSNNKLISLNLSNFNQLEKINCSDNQLTNLTLPTNPTNLKNLFLRNNNFSQNLSFLVPCTNLEELVLANNNFTGSLDYLSNLQQLKRLDISDTNINEVNLDKLPKSLENIEYSAYQRLNCQLTYIVPELRRYEHGRCPKCQQFNTSYKWCQPCAEQEWQEDIKNLTGPEVIEKFIRQQQLKEGSKWNKLQWIPYEEFTNIEHIADGGFSQIYKAECREIKKYDKDYSENVVLKSLNNSQNITLEFLTEIANTKLVRGGVVKCYGISNNPLTKNYVMVMEYMKKGSLRQYLQNQNNNLSLKDKIERLSSLAEGLNRIHDQNLIHRDFHSGNILNRSDSDVSGWKVPITDLGLSRPVNFQKQEGKIFGVLPYIAPEVLQGQPYTQASDIYSFGIVAYELLANAYPYPNLDGVDLALKVCQGYQPDIDKVPILQLLKDLIKRCWDTNPAQRPTAEGLRRIISGWYNEIENKKNTPSYQQYQALEQEYNSFSQTPYQIHPTAILTSKMINTKQIIQLLQQCSSGLLNLTIQEEPEQTPQIEIPPKNN